MSNDKQFVQVEVDLLKSLFPATSIEAARDNLNRSLRNTNLEIQNLYSFIDTLHSIYCSNKN